MTGTPDLAALIRAYLDAFATRDLERCMGFFAEDASVDFQIGSAHGRASIEQWHRDRFAANFRLVRLESIEVRDGAVVVDGAVASDPLAAWGLVELAGRLRLGIDGRGQIDRAEFTPRLPNPFAR